MSENSKEIYNKKKIAKNTLILYFKMFVTILLQLYVVPVLLRTLGVEDYGIYNVVAGVVTMLTFVSGSLSSGAQRFLAFAIGRNDENEIKKVFSSTLIIYSTTSLLIAIFLEIVGVWFLNTQMTIPVTRMTAANWVFQFTILYFAFEIMIIPFRATIIAHERMNVFAYISIIECLLRLVAAISISYIAFDGLITYSVLLFIVAIFIFLSYLGYCYYKFSECRGFYFHWDSSLGRSLLTYSGWNMMGSLALISRNQGLNIIQNIFFGPVVNAAHSIAQQVQGVANRFIDNVYVASRPQITKLYSIGRIEDMWGLIFQSAKLAFFLMMLIFIPSVLEIDTVLHLWLGEVPSYTAVISKLLLLSLLIETLVNQIISSFQAANKIKSYQITASTILLLNIPVTYFVLKYTEANPVFPYIISIVLSCLYVYAILWNAKKVIGLNVKDFFYKVLFKNIVVLIPSFVLSYLLCNIIYPSAYRIIYTVIVSTIISLSFIWFLGLVKEEKTYILNIIKIKIKKE